MTDDTARLDAVAEAIWRAGWAEESSGRTWRDCIYRKYYRHMAQAAIDSLQLTPQWAHSYEAKGQHGPWYRGTHETRSEAEDRLTELNAMYPQTEDRRGIVSRLVSPWVKVEHE